MKFEKFISLTSPGRDQYDRKYPIEIKLNDGSEILGHSVISHSDSGDISFLVIESKEFWINNSDIKMGEKRMNLNLSDIQSASNFKYY